MLSVLGSDALKAAVLGMKGARRDVKSDINKLTRTVMSPVWKSEIEGRARTRLDRRVIGAGVRVKAGNPPAGLAAQSKRKLPGGMVPVEDWTGVEFGSDRGKVTTYTRQTRKSGRVQVRRHTARQMPARSPKGRIAYAALRNIGPRMASLWVQTIVRVFSEAVEKGGK
jgi:hypothetical protein